MGVCVVCRGVEQVRATSSRSSCSLGHGIVSVVPHDANNPEQRMEEKRLSRGRWLTGRQLGSRSTRGEKRTMSCGCGRRVAEDEEEAEVVDAGPGVDVQQLPLWSSSTCSIPRSSYSDGCSMAPIPCSSGWWCGWLSGKEERSGKGRRWGEVGSRVWSWCEVPWWCL